MDLRSCLWWVISAILSEVRILIHSEKHHCLGSTVRRVERACWEPAPNALIQYAVLYCGSNVLTASIPCTLFPPQNGLLPGMVSQINPLFLKLFFFFPGDLLQQQEKYVKQKKLIAFWQFLWTPRKACEIGKVDCFLAVCVNTTKHCSLLQRAGSGYQKPSWVKNEIKWKARKMRSKHC